MKRCMLVILFFVLLATVISAAPSRAQEKALTQADAAWNEKSYFRALKLYRKALATGNMRDREEVEYRIAVSLGKTQKWDEAIATANALLGKAQWKARVLYWLGRLHAVVPHEGYKVSGKTYRRQDYPKIAGAEKPEQVYLGEEDAQVTLDFFEQAKIQAQLERKKVQASRFTRPIHPLSTEEEIDLNFDLAAYLPTREQAKFIESLDKAWKDNRRTIAGNIDNSKPYDPKWNLPTKVLYLYNEIKALDQSADKHDLVLSLLSKGLFLRAFRERMDAWAYRDDENKKTSIKRAYPFDTLKEIPIWREAVDNHPRDPIIDRILILIAQTQQANGDLVPALATYQELIRKHPKSKWVSDARALIQQITKHEVSLDTMGPQKPGAKAKITVNTRNLKRVKFTAYRVQLEKVLAQDAKLKNPNIQFTAWQHNFGNLAKARRFFGAKVAEWNFKTKDKANYQSTRETLDTPLKQLGAYAIVAEGGAIRAARILLISDLAILKKTDRDGVLAFIADAKSGAPISGANVVLKEVYYDYDERNERPRVSLRRGQSDKAGFFSKRLAQGPNIDSENVQVFAWIGNRYALTSSQYYGVYDSDDPDEVKVYSYTDRPVYRPDQKIHFRQIVTKRVAGGHQAPIKGIEVTIGVIKPNGESVFLKKMRTSEFGTVNGTFRLSQKAALGEYSVQVWVDKTKENVAASGGSRFRLEEYKRPEFQVTSEYFSLEEPIKASGNAIAVKRRYFKLTRNPEVKAEQSDVPATTSASPAVSSRRIGIAPPFPRPMPEPLKQEFTRSEINDNATLQSGDLIEVELTLDADNDYSYLVFEDMKAAGLEPVELRSGAAWGDGLCSNVELRDEKVALFVDHLPQGVRVLRYRMRAEIPGRFHTLPTNGYAMYAPEVRAISDEQRLNVKD